MSESLPEGWSRRRLGDLTTESAARNDGSLGAGDVYGVFKDVGLIPMRERVMAERVDRYKIVRRDEFAYNPMRLNIGSIARSHAAAPVLVSPDYEVFRCREGKCDPVWLDHVRRGPAWQRFVEQAGSGSVRVRIYFKDLAELVMLVPSLAEQRKIAAILSSIDDAIARTQAVIDQLQVVKTAMLEELLTRGIPGRHTRFKTTEIGEVPETWEVLRLDQVVSSGPSNGRSPLARSKPPGVPTFSIAAIRDGRINIRDNLKYTDLAPDEVKRFAVARGDVLIVRGNANPSLVGKCGSVEEAPEGCIFPDLLMRIRLTNKMLPEFLVPLWNSDIVHDQVVDRAKTTNGTFKINGEDVRSILLIVPPIEEQRALSTVFASIDASLHAHEREHIALRETKSALASALLTGELRVRVDGVSP